ncbi:MAG: tRNA 2-thiouridine(34) synthase MnmA [Bacteroidales bacterium]|nr:tRNA 2-thiouridine(34) synthase MnmA [Bacteroidales bacterium]
MPGKKVLMALSGGLDSSMAALMLKEQNYDLIGITLRVYNSQFRSEPLEQSIRDAYILADKLAIPYYVIDVFDDFKETIIDYFIDEYHTGKTPNPCALCNYQIKWKYLIQLADEFNCDYVASGHYAQVQEKNGRYYISEGKDMLKDQSYFLWRLSQEQLRRTIFPLGKYTKHQLRIKAKEKGFEIIAAKKESYNLCFIPEGNYRTFLNKNTHLTHSFSTHGNIISTKGEVLGKHTGISNYTIGQRKGIGIAHTEPFYVVKIDAKSNTITLGNKKDLEQSSIYLKDFVLSKYENLPQNKIFYTKIRYKSTPVASRVSSEQEKLKIEFLSPLVSVTPGQSAVIYEGNDLIGGGVIV